MFRKILKPFLLLILLTVPCKVLSGNTSIYSLSTLPDNRYLAITEDGQGYIWIGTLHGLARYDGYSYFLFTHVDDNPSCLKDNHVTALANSGGFLWVGSHSGLQYMSFGKKSFGNVIMPDSIDVHVTSIIPLMDGRIMVSTSNNGFVLVSPNSIKSEDQLSLSVSIYDIPDVCINCLCQDRTGLVWIGTERGVLQYNLATGITTPFAESEISDPVIGMATDRNDGTVYISTNDMLYVISNGSIEHEVVPSIPNVKILQLFSDRKGHVYASSSGNWLMSYTPETHCLERENTLSNDMKLTSMSVEAFYQDSHDNIWLGVAYSDLIMIKADNTILNPVSTSAFANVTPGIVTGMEMTADGKLWIGYMNRGLVMVDTCELQYEISQDWFVNDIIIGRDSLIWTCSNDGRIGYVDSRTNKMKVLKKRIPYRLIRMGQDSRGLIYVLELYHGLKRFDPSVNSELEDVVISDGEKQVDQHLFYTLAIDDEDRMWIGGIEGLMCFDLNGSVCLDVDERLRDLRCLEIKCDSRGRIWIRTYEQIVMYCPETDYIEFYNNPNEREVFVLQFSEDGDGNMWTGSRMNLMRINPEKHSVDMTIGVDANEEYSYASVYNKGNNCLYTGGNGNLRRFAINDIDLFPKLGEVNITGLYVKGKMVRSDMYSGRKRITKTPITLSDRFRLAYEDNTIMFRFSAVNYGNEARTSFEYMLDGQDWQSSAQGSNEIVFNNLEPGNHAIRVRARMNDMYSPEKVYHVSVRSPWYGSVVADCTYILLGLSMLVLLSLYQYRKYRQKLSDKTLDAFTNVAHELCNPLSMVISPIEDLMKSPNLNTDEKNQLIQIRKNSVRVQNAANQLIDIRRYEESNEHLRYVRTELVSFMMGLVELYTGEAARRKIQYSFNYSPQEIYGWIDTDAVDRVMTNLLSNAFKYTSDGGAIEVRISMGENRGLIGSSLSKYIELSVIDTGPGVDEDLAGKMFDKYFTTHDRTVAEFSGHGIGLHLSKILALKMNGAIWFENRLDTTGAIVSLVIPQGRDHIADDDIVDESEKSDFRESLHNMRFELQVPVVEDTKTGIGRDIKVMVIDDDESILNFMEENLKHNYRILTVKDSSNVMNDIIERMPDIIVTDLVMPAKGGDDVVRSVKKNTMTSHIPVIILSGKTSLEDRMRGIESGADYYMTKPFYLGELKGVITTLVNNRLIVKGKFSGNMDQENMVKPVEFKSSDEIFMKKVMDIINENMSNPDFAVEDVQNKVGLGRTQLFRKLKELTGFPPARFIQNVRMNQAYLLVKEKQMDITQIAYAVGFSSQTHFSTMFRQYFGVSPSELIVQTREQNSANAGKDGNGEKQNDNR